MCNKVCSGCKEDKHHDTFYKDKSKNDMLSSSCKECVKKRAGRRYALNPKKSNDKAILWAQKNRSRSREIKAKYASINRVRNNKITRERRLTDENFRIKCNLRTRISTIVSGKIKPGSAVSDLGCTIIELRLYIEDMFDKNMNWCNYGIDGWHIDHIKPLSSFDLTNRGQFLEACRYTNLQPLWAKDNLSKGAKISEEYGNV